MDNLDELKAELQAAKDDLNNTWSPDVTADDIADVNSSLL